MNQKANRGAFPLSLFLMLQGISGSVQAQDTTSGLRFSQIDVRGNTYRSDDEILALCNLAAENRYTSDELYEALDCLGQSGQFEAVSLDTEGSALIVNVTEVPRYTGLLDIGVSADSDRGLSANLYVEKQELFSEQLSGSFSAEVSGSDQYLGAFLVDEDVFGMGVPGGLNLEYSAQDYPEAAYDTSRLEFGSFLEFRRSEASLIRVRGGVQSIETDDINPAAGSYMLGEEQRLTRLFASLEYEREQDFNLGSQLNASFRFTASQQVYQNMNADGGGGKSEISAAVRAHTNNERFSFGASFSGGHVAASGGGRTSIADRFQLGGNSLRGFSERSIGPKENGYNLGGNSFAVMRLEGDMRFATFDNVELRGGLFAEAGSAWGLDAASAGPDDRAHLRSSVGVSLEVEVGETPINLYYAVPVDQVAGDDEQRFGFSLSRRF